MIVMTQSSCTRWVSVFINVSSGVTQVSHGMIFQSCSEVSDGMILQSSLDVSCGIIFRCSSEGSCGIDRDIFFCIFFNASAEFAAVETEDKEEGLRGEQETAAGG